MFRGDWDDELKAGGIIAAVALILATVAWAQSLNQKNDSANQSEQQQISEMRRLDNPRLYQPNCQSPEDNEEADLCAQQDMSEAAWELYRLTALQLVLTALGTGAILLSLKFTRDALGHAEASAKASADAVTVAREIGQAQATSYLTCIDVSVHTKDGRPMLALKIDNTGHSPAFGVRVDCMMQSGFDWPSIMARDVWKPKYIGSIGQGKATSEFAITTDQPLSSIDPPPIGSDRVGCIFVNVIWMNVFRRRQSIMFRYTITVKNFTTPDRRHITISETGIHLPGTDGDQGHQTW